MRLRREDVLCVRRCLVVVRNLADIMLQALREQRRVARRQLAWAAVAGLVALALVNWPGNAGYDIGRYGVDHIMDLAYPGDPGSWDVGG